MNGQTVAQAATFELNYSLIPVKPNVNKNKASGALGYLLNPASPQSTPKTVPICTWRSSVTRVSAGPRCRHHLLGGPNYVIAWPVLTGM